MSVNVQSDLRKELKDLYTEVGTPKLVDVPPLRFLMVDGQGDPAAPAFAQAMQALYATAYALKFRMKALGVEHTVMPSEGLWSNPDPTGWNPETIGNWRWTLMIAQPPAVTDELVRETLEDLGKKKDVPALGLVRFETFAEGWAAQVLHVGPYASEPETIARLHAFIRQEGMVPTGRHHEIYLGDPRRSAPERLKTILRQPVEPSEA
jgi:hypothetical protein